MSMVLAQRNRTLCRLLLLFRSVCSQTKASTKILNLFDDKSTSLCRLQLRQAQSIATSHDSLCGPHQLAESAPSRAPWYWTSPPVTFQPSDGAPTAMSWLRRRGPSIPHSVLERAFRKRKVLVQLEGCKTGRISKKTLLQAGARLIMPNSYIVDEQQSTDGLNTSTFSLYCIRQCIKRCGVECCVGNN